MNSDLRPHQTRALAKLKSSLMAGKRRPMLAMPTGAGKTILSAAIVEGALRKGNRVIFTVPRISLIDQTVAAFWREGITDVGVIQSSHPMTNASRAVQVASVQTLRNRDIPPADVVVIDEAHEIFESVVRWMNDAAWRGVPFIGLSATPWTRGLGQHYDDLIVAATTQELIDEGYLAPFRVFAPSHPDLSGVRTVAGDYHEGDLGAAMDRPALTADVVETWRRMGEDRPTLCFAVNCAHARGIQARFQEAGIPCGYVDARTSVEERERVGRAFHAGDLKVICNVGVLTTGVDLDVRCIILARPTKSEMLYCLDAETEILTSHGWKGIGQVRLGDCAATLADIETGRGQWSPIVGIVERDMDMGERWVEYDAPRANFRVTDQHMLIAASMNDAERRYRRVTAAEVVAIKGGVKMPTAVSMDQPGVPLNDAELYFIGMMMSDGTWTSTTGSITQSERHPEIVERIESALRGCGIGYAKRRVVPICGSISERYPRWRFDFSAGKPRAHGSLGRAMCGNDTKVAAEHIPGTTGFLHLLPYLDKDFSPALMALSQSQLDRLLQGIWDGDGSKKKGVDYTPRSMEICSARKCFVDRLQALCAINGYTANVRKEHGASRKTPIWLITITPKDWRSCGGYAAADRGQRPQIEMKPATPERVWCVETETGTIITRRRGKVTVMGNCQMIGRGLRTADDKIDCLVLDHSDTTQRLGFVTDIHHDELDDGKPRKSQSETRTRAAPLPKECPKCSRLKPAGVHACPSCGFRPERQSGIECGEGELVELRASRKPTPEDKRRFYAQLKGYALERGKSEKWVLAMFRSKFHEWPHGRTKQAGAVECGPEVLGWIRSRQIAWAKSRRGREAA